MLSIHWPVAGSRHSPPISIWCFFIFKLRRISRWLRSGGSRWCVSDPLPPSAALPLVRGRRERSERGVAHTPSGIGVGQHAPSNVLSSLVMRIVNIIRVAAVLLTLAMLQTTAAAHDFSTSYSRVTVHGEAVEVRLTLNRHDFHTADLAEAIEANYRLEAPEPPSSREIRSSNTIADNVVLLDLLYTFAHPVTSLRITSTLDRIAQADHSHIIDRKSVV